MWCMCRLGEVLAHQTPVALAVALGGPAHDLVRQRGRRRLPVPAAPQEEVTDALLVVRGRRAAWRVRRGIPVPRGIRRPQLVDELDLAVVQPELELRVREDEPLRRSDVVRQAVELARHPLELAGALRADHALEL